MGFCLLFAKKHLTYVKWYISVLFLPLWFFACSHTPKKVSQPKKVLPNVILIGDHRIWRKLISHSFGILSPICFIIYNHHPKESLFYILGQGIHIWWNIRSHGIGMIHIKRGTGRTWVSKVGTQSFSMEMSWSGQNYSCMYYVGNLTYVQK